MKKRILAFVLAAVMLFALAACTTKPAETEKNDPAAKTETNDKKEPANNTSSEKKEESKTEDKPADKPEEKVEEKADRKVDRSEKVKLTIGLSQRTDVVDYKNNALTKWLEDTCNVDLDFVFYTDSKTQVATSIAANEKLPDIFYGLALGNGVYDQYDADGYFLDLGQWLKDEDFMANYDFLDNMKQELTEEQQETYWKIVTNVDDGGIYQLASDQEAIVGNTTLMMQINKTWLDNLGMEIPTDMDSFIEVLKAFRDKDPNGNGIADEIPLLGSCYAFSTGHHWLDVLPWIINNYEYYNERYIFNADKDGNLYHPAVTDNYREALKTCRYLVDENLLSTTSFTITTTNEIKEMTNPADGTEIVGAVTAHRAYITNNDLPYHFDYVGLVPFNYAPTYFNVSRNCCIAADCEYPERAMDVLLTLGSREGGIRQVCGVPGVDWEERIGPDGKPYIYQINTVFQSCNTTTTWALDGFSIKNDSTGYWKAPVEYKEPITEMDPKEYGTWEKTRYHNEYQAQHAKTTPAGQPYVITLNTEENEICTPISTELRDFIRQARAEFATGVRDINSDADWDAYLKAVEAIGLDQLTKIYQAEYDAQYK